MKPIEKKLRRDEFAITLPVDPPEIPERIRTIAKQYGMAEKLEHHVSVMVTKNARLVEEAIEKSRRTEEMLEKTRTTLDALDWTYELTDEYYLQENAYVQGDMAALGYKNLPNHTRRTIIQRVRMPDMATFYKQISKLLNVSLDIPVPHVTLFSWSDYPPMMTRGIGISSEQDFRSYTKRKL